MSTEGSVARDSSGVFGSETVYVGRQPVFDRNLAVVAYELLYRSSCANAAAVEDGDRATAQVFANAFMELGLDTVAGHHPVLINLPRSFIVEDYGELFPPERILLEVLEDVEPDADIIRRVKTLSEAGYRIVLDDFFFREDLRPLVEIADMIKLDVRELLPQGLAAHVERLRPYGVQLLAEKIETHEELELCRDLGFDYFQGYFLSKPQVMQGQRLAGDRLALIRLLAKVNDPGVGLDEIDEIVSHDVTLSYRLLRYINSMSFAIPLRVDSIRHALVLLGRRMVVAWVNVVILGSVSGKPSELVTTAMIRAKMCERIGILSGITKPEPYFTAGLFSTLDAITDRPLAEVLSELPLQREVEAALISSAGAVGRALRCTLAYERMDWEEVAASGVAPGHARQAFVEALSWVQDARGAETAGDDDRTSS